MTWNDQNWFNLKPNLFNINTILRWYISPGVLFHHLEKEENIRKSFFQNFTMVPYMQKNGNLILKLAKWNEVKNVIFQFYTTRVIWAYEFISNVWNKIENMVNLTSTDIYNVNMDSQRLFDQEELLRLILFESKSDPQI